MGLYHLTDYIFEELWSRAVLPVLMVGNDNDNDNDNDNN